MVSTHRIQRIQDAGYRLTKVRLTVLQILEDNGGHMTSSQILDAIQQQDNTIGRASVFRTLDLLTTLTIIRPTYVDSSMTPTYVMMPDGHHHHIVCSNCNAIIEFEECDLDDLSERLQKTYGVQITGHLLEFYGLCQNCLQQPG